MNIIDNDNVVLYIYIYIYVKKTWEDSYITESGEICDIEYVFWL